VEKSRFAEKSLFAMILEKKCKKVGGMECGG